MEQMQYKIFVWPELPETFHISAVRTPEFTVDESGRFSYTGLSPMARVITGSGVFRGKYAYENFNTLQVLLATGTAGELSHPIWGTFQAFLVELRMDNQPGDGYVAYSFQFREADESGLIPALPTDWVDNYYN